MISRRRLILSYTIQQVIPNICTKFKNPRCSSSWEIFDEKKSLHTHKHTQLLKRQKLYTAYTWYARGIIKIDLIPWQKKRKLGLLQLAQVKITLSVDINSITGKKLELLAFLDFHHCGYSGNKNWQLHCNFIIVPQILPIQCIQERQKPSWGRCDVTCSQGYFTYANHVIGKQLGSQFVLKCSQTKPLIMWQVGTGNLVVPVKTFNCSEISLTILGTNTKVKKLPSVHF